MDNEIPFADACAVLHVDQNAAALLMSGPFAPTAGLLHIRQVLGCAVVLALPMVSGEAAVSIALTASRQASTDEPHRLLAVGWNDATGPVGCWLSNGLPPDTRNVLLTLPADRLLADLTERLAEHRASMQRPN